MNENKIDIIINNLAELDKKLEIHINNCKHSFEAIKILDEKQNEQLELHIARSDAIERQNELTKEQLEIRIAELKLPYELIKMGVKVTVSLAALITALSVIVKYLPK